MSLLLRERCTTNFKYFSAACCALQQLSWIRVAAIFLVVSVFAGVPPTRADYASQVLSLNPNQYWRLNETSGPTAANQVGSGVPGTYSNTTLGLPGPRPPAFPGFDDSNNTPQFNGLNSVVTTGSALLDNQSAFTMLGWFYQTANQPNRTSLFGQDNTIEFGFIEDDTLQLWTFAGGGCCDPGLDVAWDGSLNNSWVFAAAVGDGTNTRIYLNGELAGSVVDPTGTYGASGPFSTFTVGANVFSGGGHYNGLIDEVAIFTNRALTAIEIHGLYEAATVPEPASLILFISCGCVCGLLRFRRVGN